MVSKVDGRKTGIRRHNHERGNVYRIRLVIEKEKRQDFSLVRKGRKVDEDGDIR